MAGGLNLYGYAEGDPVNFSDPFGLWPEWLQRARAAYRSWSARQEEEFNGLLRDIERDNGFAEGDLDLVMEMTMGSTGGARAAATLARRGTQLRNLLTHVDQSHLSAARAELSGAASHWDHVTEVRNAMNGLRNVIRSMNGMLKDKNLSAEAQRTARELRRQAVEALEKAKEALRQ